MASVAMGSVMVLVASRADARPFSLGEDATHALACEDSAASVRSDVSFGACEADPHGMQTDDDVSRQVRIVRELNTRAAGDGQGAQLDLVSAELDARPFSPVRGRAATHSTVVPEPASLLLLGTGLAAAAGVIRRRAGVKRER